MLIWHKFKGELIIVLRKFVMNSVTVIYNKYYVVKYYKFTEIFYVLVTFALQLAMTAAGS